MHTHRFVFTVIAVTLVVATPRALAFEGEVEYCGGEETAVDAAFYEYQSGSYDAAREMLVDGIKHGGIESWQRPQALALLGEVQLRMSDFRPAAYNYRRAMELDPVYAGEGARVGYAIALHRMRRSDEALAVARAHTAETCATAEVSPGCYVAFTIVSVLTEDETEMFEAMRSADAILRGYPEIEAEIDWLLAAIESR